MGSYTYSGYGPHAVSAAGSNSYTYDANGNMLTGGNSGNQSYTWTSFNQVKLIANSVSTKSTEFFFGANHERVKQVRKTGSTVTDTTIYVGSLYEKVTAGSLVTHKHYIMAPTGRIAVFTDRSDLTKDLRYFHTDGLGSITVISDEAGRVLKRYTYDAWGKQSTLYTNTASGLTNQAPTTRGFTDHEELSDFGLVHMNGRVYDPVVGRFLSADPFVGDSTDAQDFNRYSYLSNNPLGGTDPSGYVSIKDVLKIAVTVAISVVTYGLATGASFAILATQTSLTIGQAWAVGSVIGGAVAGFASSFSSSLLNGASIGEAFRAGVNSAPIGALTAGLLNKVGAQNWGWLRRGVAHGLIQGGAAEATGGEFRHGFYAGFAVGSTEKGIAAVVGESDTAGIAAAAVVGGTAAELGGGKFANGAVSGAFSYMFNQLSTRWATRDEADEFRKNTIKPHLDDLSALSGMELGGDAAEELLLGTALHESGGLIHRRQIRGPALGLFQMEPNTHDDIWDNYLQYRPRLANALRNMFTPAGGKLDASRLAVDDGYATAMARVHYLRRSGRDPLPKAGDLAGQAKFWKIHYNTSAGKGTEAKYIADWNRTNGN